MKPFGRTCSQLLLALLLAALPGMNRAQEPAAVRKIVLPSLESQVQARLIALDRRLNPVHSPSLAISLIGQAPAFAAFVPILTDPRNLEVWEQLPEEYYRTMLESGDALVTEEATPRAGSAWSSGQVRRLCHHRLTLLPRSSLEWYRQRVDAEARALLEQGRQTRSAAPLRRLVDELFCSSVGDQALDLLGDLAFERGQFDEARYWWSLLAPLQSPHADRLRFPDPKVDTIRAEAKQILARIFQGRLRAAKSDIDTFERRHPNAKGALAAEQGNYGKILLKTLTAFEQKPFANNDEPWTTFGGDATRNRPLSQEVPYSLLEDGPTWHVKLPALNPTGKAFDPDRLSLSRRAAFHPVILHQQVLLADHRSVVSHDLKSGKELFRFDLKTAGLNDPGPGVDPHVRLPRFTLSVDDERAYVRLGGLGIGPRKDADGDDPSYLVCLDLTQPEQNKKRQRWHIKASADDKSPAFFEGSPLVHDGRVYIALSKLAGRRLVTSIVCYDTQGRQRWTREVCDSPEFEEGTNGPRTRHHLLTWADGQIVYCSHAGAIAAVDAWTGQPTWGVRYPSRGPLRADLEPSARDLTPCVFADGRVYVAPLDAERLFCLDAVTGQIHWELEDVEIGHLMGVTLDRVFFTTRDGLQAADARTGQIDWTQPTEGRLASLGRGLLAGGSVIWPTQDALLPYWVVTQSTGQPQFEPTMYTTLPVGNMALGHGCLAIAGLDELFVYVPAHRQPPPLERPQARVDTLYQQARTQASAGQTVPAARTYLELLDATKALAQAADWRRLIEGRLLMLEMTGRRDPVAGAQGWSIFTDPRMPPAVRLAAWKRQGDAASVLRDPAARQAWLPGALPEQGVVWAVRQQTTYRGEPDDVVALYHFVKQNGDQPKERDRLRQIAEQALKVKHWGHAADANRRLLALPLPAEFRAKAQLDLARAYDRQRDRTPSAIDGPALPLVRAWSQVDGRVWTPDSQDHFFFCTQPGKVTCRTVADGALRWQQKLDCTPTWLDRWQDLVLILSPDLVQALRVQDGQPAWSFPAPSRLVPLGSVRQGIPMLKGAAGFVHVQREADTLLLLDDRRAFFRLRLDTGEVLWRHPLMAAFEPHFLGVGNRLLGQSSAGQPVWLGVKPEALGERSRPWIEPPRLVGNCLVMAGEAGRIQAYEPKPPHVLRWTYQPLHPTSLTGELCRLFVQDSVLLALVPRNDGLEWLRLDAARGKTLWSVPANRLPDGLDAGSVCIGELAYYYVSGQRLYARSLNDGSLQWEQSLPTQAARWRVRYTKDYLAVHPVDATPDADFCVAFVDPLDGRWLQRLSVPGARGKGEVLLMPSRVLVSVAGKIYGFRSLDAE